MSDILEPYVKTDSFSPIEFFVGEVDPCYYCGLVADTVDHVLPKTIEDRIDGIEIRNTLRTYTVPCCRECNSLLGPKWYPTLTERKYALKEKLRKRYRKYLELPEWNDKELESLGPTLQSQIIRGQRLKELIRERLRW